MENPLSNFLTGSFTQYLHAFAPDTVLGSEGSTPTKVIHLPSWNILVGGGRREEEGPINKQTESMSEGGNC